MFTVASFISAKKQNYLHLEYVKPWAQTDTDTDTHRV